MMFSPSISFADALHQVCGIAVSLDFEATDRLADPPQLLGVEFDGGGASHYE